MDTSKWNLDVFGDSRPCGDPGWYQGQYSPYYNESHRELRSFVREFVENEIMPFCHEWDDKDKEIPKKVYKLMGENGLNLLSMGHPFPLEYGQPPTCLQSGTELDPFHEVMQLPSLGSPAHGDALTMTMP